MCQRCIIKRRQADFYANDVDGLQEEGNISLKVYLDMCEEKGIELLLESFTELEQALLPAQPAGKRATASKTSSGKTPRKKTPRRKSPRKKVVPEKAAAKKPRKTK